MYIRNPCVAGMFYTANKKELYSEIDKYIKSSQKDSNYTQLKHDNILGLVSPHAGYIYSGPVAAYSFSQLIDSNVELAVVLALSHRVRLNGASVIPEGIYKTPLGDVEIDSILGQKLVNEDGFHFYEEVHESEHSLEVQVPFLQYSLKNFKIVPIIIGSYQVSECEKLAKNIYKHLKDEKRKFTIIISTDLSHYHSYDEASQMDNNLAETLKHFNENEVYKILTEGKSEACGISPLITGIILTKLLGAKKTEILKYANSGDTAGDKNSVVGYLSAAFLK